MYCSYCGTKCIDGARFCIKCGQKLMYNKDGTLGYNSEDILKQTEPIENIIPKSNSGFLAEEGTLSKIGFPAAGASFVLHGILFLYYYVINFKYIYLATGEIVGIGYFTWQTGILLLLFVCAVLSFLKKIKPFSIALIVYSIWNVIWSSVLPIRFGRFTLSPYWGADIISFGIHINMIYVVIGINILSYGILAFLAIMTLKGNGSFTIAKKIWYIPWSLFCIILLHTLLVLPTGTDYNIWGLFEAVDVLCSIAEMMFSGWGLTHPYKKRSIQTYHTDSIDKPIPLHGRENVATGINSGEYSGDAPSFGYAVLGCIIPIAGLVLYLVWKEQTPLRANSAGKGALIGVIAWVGLSVLTTILSFILPMVMLGGYY